VGHEILLRSDDLFSRVFAAWKPQLKKLEARNEVLEVPTSRSTRTKTAVINYSGMDSTRKSNVEKAQRKRVLFRRLNKII
jgi:hypothetical protein